VGGRGDYARRLLRPQPGRADAARAIPTPSAGTESGPRVEKEEAGEKQRRHMLATSHANEVRRRMGWG